MKAYLKKSLLLITAAIVVVGCDADISGSLDKDGDPGTADFTTFVAVGDSLTAGYADSALYRHGQENSYPAILAQQFALAGGGAFTQPLRGPEFTGSFVGIPDDVIMDRLMIVASGNPERPVKPSTIAPVVPENLAPMPGILYNNFGVPSAKLPNVDDADFGNPLSPTANPFYVRFAFAPGVSTMIDDAVARMPTFFILWIGNNDILLNAASGSPGSANPTFGEGLTDVTPTATFVADYPGLVGDLKSATNKGLLISIPKVDTIPYFTTVPYNAIPLDAATATLLNLQFSDYNTNVMGLIGTDCGDGALGADEAAARQVVFQAGNNAALILDETLTSLTGCSGLLANMRQATADDLILLPTSEKLGVEDVPGNPATIWGVSNPLLDVDVLIKDEADSLEAVRQAYNAVIKAQADADPDILFYDAAESLQELNDTGISYGSGGITSAFIQGGGFSADGIHPTARGYAVIANEIFKVINAGFGAYIPPVDPNQYTTVFYQ